MLQKNSKIKNLRLKKLIQKKDNKSRFQKTRSYS